MLEKHGYISAIAFAKGSAERTPAIFGLLQRNSDRTVRHLFQQPAAPTLCSSGGISRSSFRDWEKGDLSSHPTEPMLEYIESAFEAYPDVPVFAHIHSVIAHGGKKQWSTNMERRRGLDHALGPRLPIERYTRLVCYGHFAPARESLRLAPDLRPMCGLAGPTQTRRE